MRMTLRGILIATMCLLATPRTGWSYEVLKEHPRVYFTRADLPVLKERARTTHRAAFDLLIQAANGFRAGDRIALGDWGYQRAFPTLAFAFLMTDEGRYIEALRHYMDTYAAGYDARDKFLNTEVLWHATMAYDWCHDRWSAEERRRYAGLILKVSDALFKEWRHNDFGNQFVLQHVSPQLFAGVALSGDGIDDARAKAILDTAYDNLVQHALPAAAYEGGGHLEGFGYSAWGFTRPLAYALEMWRVATGEDLFKGNPYFEGHAAWNLLCRRPHDGAQERMADCPSNTKWGPANEGTFMPLIAGRMGDGYAQWIANQIPVRYGVWAWMNLLWYDPAREAKGPETLPMARLFRGVGQAAMRSAWGDPDATFAMFLCADHIVGHQHMDANSFVIHKRGSLAVDSGANDYGAHGRNYYWRTVAHNSVTVTMPGEDFYYNGTESNDGGQNVFARSNHGNEPIPTTIDEVRSQAKWDIADIAGFETNNFYTYVLGDATRAYDPRKLTQFTRQFLFIRPDYFVIFDRVTSKDASYPKRWLLHALREPAVQDDLVTVTEGRGRLFCRTLLPEGARIEKVGGPGREFEVEGVNYPPSPDKLRESPEAGAWRVEVQPAQAATEDLFLHVFQATEAGTEAMIPVERVTQGEREGVRLRVGGRTCEALFNRTGPPGGTFTIREGERTLFERDLTRTVIEEPRSFEEGPSPRPGGDGAMDARRADFDGDGRVDFDDFFLFAGAFGSPEARFDLDGSGGVDFSDFFLFAAVFGK